MVKHIIDLSTHGVYKLTTAEILYYLPDYKEILQAYLWQEYDFDPYFPNLKSFLQFWNRELEGKLHSVKIATSDKIIKEPINFAYYEGRIN